MTTLLYVDCYAGIAGDMMLGALVDAGVPEAVIREALAAIPLDGYSLRFERVMRGALVGTKAIVDVADAHGHDHDHDHGHDHGHAHTPDHHHAHHAGHAHRHYAEIRALLDGLPAPVRTRARAIFDRLAEVEAKLHGTTVDEVAFHEVGAVDSIVDIVGAAAGLAWLQPARVVVRRVPLGGGTVQTAHGLLPVPAPATLALLAGAGAPVEEGGPAVATVELTTPTGAAILAACADGWGPPPPMRVRATGWGAGDRELGDRPNLLRLVIGDEEAAAPEAHDVVEIAANVDDMNPELYEPLLAALFAAGAVDAWLTPIVMKKGRPAITVTALAPVAAAAAVRAAMLAESTTLGVRYQTLSREALARRIVDVETPFGRVLVKLGSTGGVVTHVAPEYESCRARAVEAGVPTRRVWAAALAAAEAMFRS